MKPQGSRFLILLALLLVVLSQLMCNLPDKNSSQVLDISPDEAVELLDLWVNIYEVAVSEEENTCGDHIKIPDLQRLTAYEFNPQGVLIVKTTEEAFVFAKIGPRKYCMDESGLVCIHDLSDTGYVLTVDSGLEECYRARYDLTSINDQLLNDDVVQALLPDDTQAEKLPEGDSESPPADDLQPQPDPEPEYSRADECNAAALLYVDTSEAEITTSPSDETTCEYTITLTNIGDENIKVFLFKHLRFYTGDEEGKWGGKWSLAPGESMQVECEKETRNWVEDVQNKTSFHFVEKLAPIFDRPGCLNTFDNNAAAKEAVAIPVKLPCE